MKSLAMASSDLLHCSVPCCNSDTDNSPNKLFINVPDNFEQRKLWFEQAHMLSCPNLFNDPNISFCEDHFDDILKSIPTKFECQYFREGPISDYSNNSLQLPYRNLKLSQILNKIKLTKITVKKKETSITSDILQGITSVSSDTLQGNASTNSSDILQGNASISLDKLQGNTSISSDKLQGNASIPKISFKPELEIGRVSERWSPTYGRSGVEVGSPKPETPHSHSTSKMKAPIILKMSKPDKKFNEEFTETNKVNKNDSFKFNDFDETINVINQINHDHQYPFRESNRSPVDPALKEHDYALNSLHYSLRHYYSRKKTRSLARTRNKKPKIQDNFFRGEQVYIDEEYSHETHLLNHIKNKHVDNEETDSAESIPTFKCDYCDLEYVLKTHLFNHIQEQHLDIKPEIYGDDCDKEYSHKTQDVVNEETDSAESTLSGGYCDKDYSHKTHLNHIKIQHAVNEKTDSAVSMPTLGGDYGDEEYFIKRNLLNNKKQHAVNEETDSAKSMRFWSCDYKKCYRKYLQIGHLINHIKNKHGINKERDSPESMPNIRRYNCDKEYSRKKRLYIKKQLVDSKETDNAESMKSWTRKHAINKERDSAESIPKLRGDNCDKEYSHKTCLLNIKKQHVDNKETDDAESIKSWTCNYCNKKYLRMGRLLNHIKDKHVVNLKKYGAKSMPTLRSDYCDTETHLLDHIKKQHAVNEETNSAESKISLRCDYCNKEYLHEGRLSNHIKNKHKDSALRMPTLKCGKKYYLLNRMNHIKKIKKQCLVDEELDSAESTPTLRCDYCNKGYFLKGHLANHIKYNHVDSVKKLRTLKCDSCDKKYYSKMHLVNHIKKQHAVNEETNSAESKIALRCDYCNKVYLHEGRLSNHIKNKHKDSALRIPTLKCGKKYLLNRMNRIKKQCLVDKEIDSAESTPILRCDYCNKGYFLKGHLSNHIKYTHVDSVKKLRTSKCDSCDKKYYSKMHLVNHIKKHHAVNGETDSAKSKCFRCDKEFHHKSDLSNHFQEQHIVIKGTDSAESMSTFKCDYCEVEYHHEADLLSHIHEEHSDMQVESLDIKPEIFQCSNCPSSFSNEREMSKHLQIMHGNLIDLYMENKKCKIDPKKNKNTNDLLIEKVCEKFDEGQKECQNNFAAYSFAELRIETEIKREFSDPLEDVELPDEQHLGLYPMYELDSDFPANQCNFNDVNGTTDIELANDFHSPEHINVMNINLNPETVNIKKEFTESDNDQYFGFPNKYGLTQIENDNSCTNVIKCRSCQLPFSSQEALLDHIHELINTKALDHIHELTNTKTKLHAESEREFKMNSVQFQNPGNFSDKPYLNEAQLMENIHKDVDNSQKNDILEDVGPTDFEDKGIRKQVYPKDCRCCSKPLPTKIIKGKCDNICKTCKKIEIQNGKRRKSSEAQSHCRRAKIIQIKKCTDVKSHIGGNKTKSLRDKQLLENMHRFFIKSQKKRAHARNKRKDRVDDKILVKVKEEMVQDTEEMVQGTFLFNDNDLLKPLREEDEKIIVPSREEMVQDTFLFNDSDLLKPLREEDEKIIVPSREEMVQDTFLFNDNDLLKPLREEDEKIIVPSREEMVQVTFLFNDNDLLKPLREEDEKIIVPSRDSTLCKSCLIPLNELEKSGQINTVCDKCRALETSNEKRRKSNEKRRKSHDNFDKKHSANKSNAKNKFDCNICRSKFNNKLSLREHVGRTHL